MRRSIIAVAVMAVLALAGTAYGASKITSSQIKDNTITSKDIKNNTIRASDISDQLYNDLSGEPGPPGAQGPVGPPSAPGAPGASGIAQIVSAQGSGTGLAVAYCPAGTRPVSGGGIEEGTGYIFASGAAKDAGRLGWLVAGDVGSPMTAFAYCSAGVASFTFPDGSVGSTSSPMTGSDGLLSVEKIRRMQAARSR